MEEGGGVTVQPLSETIDQPPAMISRLSEPPSFAWGGQAEVGGSNSIDPTVTAPLKKKKGAVYSTFFFKNGTKEFEHTLFLLYKYNYYDLFIHTCYIYIYI